MANPRNILAPGRNDVLQIVAFDTRFGSGINSGGTDRASMTIPCAIDCTKFEGIGVAIIFVEVVSAFAAMCHMLVFDILDCEADLVRKLTSLSFTRE